MYLKRLELHGFKSFADKTVLEFMPGITTVVGPNGSGKSNISDAIRWVLGEQSMKSLRGAKSEDVIFAGTQSRKSLGFAECSIVFDNADGKLPIEFGEVTVTRRLYRSGETGYFINNSPCRLKDILELFMDTGIGKDGYSIIGQGKIDEILSNKSEDRRHIFEEAAGIVKYRTRKAESEKKLEQTKLNLLRINDILAEIESKIEPLKSQSEKAKKYLSLHEELKSIEIGLFLYNIDSYKEKLQALGNDISTIRENLSKEEENQENLQSLREQLKLELENLNEQVEGLQNLEFESGKEIENLNSDIKVAKQKCEAGRENSARYKIEIEECEKKIAELEDEIKQRNEKKTALYSSKEKFTKELEEKQAELEKITATLSDKAKKIEEKKKKIEEDTDLKYEKKNEINSFDANIINFEKRKRQLSDEISSNISELDSLRMTKSEKTQEFMQIEVNRTKLKDELDKIVKRRDEKQEILKQKEDKINDLMKSLGLKETRKKFLEETEREKEGYIRSVKELLLECDRMPELKKGMHGVLADLITVPKEYETAIEMCLGQALQNIVTDTEETAKKLVEHLREKKLGRASFLPISSVKGQKVDRLIKNALEGVIGVASDLIKCDKQYEQIVLNLLGRTVIVEDMDTGVILARQNQYRFRIVTLKGDVINASGSITGGYVEKKTVSLLGRKQEIQALEKEIKDNTSTLEILENEKERFSSEIQDFLEETASIERQTSEIEISYATEKQKIEALEESIQKAEARLNTLRIEQNKLKDEIENANNSKEKVNRRNRATWKGNRKPNY